MLTPSSPRGPHEATHSASTASVERAAALASDESARHAATSLALLGVMLIFFAALIAAERHELHALRESSQTAGASLGIDISLEALAIQADATLAFGRALLIAGVGVTAASLTLLLRRPRFWIAATILALGCLVTSAHLFTVARAQVWAQTRSLGTAAPR